MINSKSWAKGFYVSLFHLGAFFFCSCSEPPILENPISEFLVESNLSSERLNSSDSLFSAGEMLLYNDILLVLDEELDYLFKVIDVEEDSFIKRFGKIGQGPCELDPFISVFKSGPNGEMLGTFELQTREFQEYPIDQILDSKSEMTCLAFDKRFDSKIRYCVKIDDNLFLGAGTENQPYSLLKGNDVIKTFGEFPFASQFEGVEPMVLDLAFQNKFYHHPTEALVLSSSRFSFNMDILDYRDGGNMKIKKSMHFWPTEFESSSGSNVVGATIKEGNMFGNVSTTVSNNFIYVLYSDVPWKYKLPLKSKRVLVYDWNGEPIKILHLDQEVNRIAVPENDQFLIGYMDDGKANLFRYELN